MKIGIVGLGYVGPAAGRRLRRGGARGRRPRPRPEQGRGAAARGAATSRTSPTRPWRRSRERLHPTSRLRRPGRLRGGRRLRADAADQLARARPRLPARRRRRASPTCCAGPAGRPGVDHLPGDDARAAAPILEELGAARPAGTSTSPSRRSGSTPAAPTTPCARRRSWSAASRGACAERARALYAEICDDVVVVSTPGGGRAVEAAREHLPLGQHRPRQRALPALRPARDRRLGGDRRRLDQAVRLHALRARPRGWAATACRSTPSTSPSRRASTTSTPSSSSSPARSTRPSRPSAWSGSSAR